MALEEIPSISEDKFSVNTKLIERIPNVFIEGTVDLPDPGIVLNPYFEDFHNAIMERGSREVKINIDELEYINSSGIKSIIRYVMKILSLPPEKQYKVKIAYNSEKDWQQSSFKPVTLLAPKIVEINPK